LSFDTDKDIERRRKSNHASETASARRPARKKSGNSGDIGNALRSAYQRTVSEDIPPDLLDLLGKLG